MTKQVPYSRMELAEVNEGPGKFQGETLAVQVAYEQALDGFAYDDFGSVQEHGFYARVFVLCRDVKGGQLLVCFTELTNAQYEAAYCDWVEANEEQEDADQ